MALFGRGAPFNEDDAAYPAMSELRDELHQLHGQIGEHLAGMDAADLEKTLKSDPVFQDTDAVKTTLLLRTHDFLPRGSDRGYVPHFRPPATVRFKGGAHSRTNWTVFSQLDPSSTLRTTVNSAL